MPIRWPRLVPPVTVALALSLFGVPTEPPGLFVEPADASVVRMFGADEAVRSTTFKAAFDPIPTQTRGTRDVAARATVGQSGLICRLSIQYRDDEGDSPDPVVSDARGVCTIHFDVPERRTVIGTASAKLKVTNTKGVTKGKASRSFQVK